MLRLIAHPANKILTKWRPDFPNKYIGIYLASSFSKSLRREIFLHHYRYMIANAPQNFHGSILEQPKILWRSDSEESMTIIFGFNERYHQEGDLLLRFMAKGKQLFLLSFSIAPGAAVGSPHRNVMLVGCVHGTRNEAGAIKEATKLCSDIFPPYLLMASAQAIATRLGLDAIVGVSSREQLANRSPELFLFRYDDFWRTFVGSETEKNFYQMPIPPVFKPLEVVSPWHRRRARRKRTIREGVFTDAFAAFSALLAG